jgi:CRP/FNR family cyclic AMP-dependent transcriptional regulator
MATEAVLTLVEKTALLKSYPVFGAVATEALATLAARAQERHYDAGGFVFREGEPNRAIVMVVEGQLEVRKRGQFIRIVDAGTGFGQLELRDGDPLTVSLVALAPTHVIWVTVEDLFDSVSDYPEIGVGLIRLLAGRLQELLDHIQIVEQEVARLVARLKEAGVPLPGEDHDRGSNAGPTP